MPKFPPNLTGLGANGRANGKITIAFIKAGRPAASLEMPAKDAGKAASTILAAALASYVLSPNRPPVPKDMKNLPVLQATTIGIGEHPKPNHYTLQVFLGEAQIGFELSPSMLRPLGQALIAASAGGSGAKPQ